MNRFQRLFSTENKKVFIPFFTIGDPNYEASLALIKSVIEAGADALELGFAFSDPIADGPTNQRSMERALQSGMSFERSIAFLKEIRQISNDIPIGLLIYYNLLFKQGESAYQALREAGVDAIVSADLPLEEAQMHLALLKKYHIGSVQMIAPNTNDKRIALLSSHTTAFNYVLSGFGTTGARSEVAPETIKRIQHVRALIDEPMVVGFGISKPEHVRTVWEAGANGAIVGSFFTSIIEKNLNNLHHAQSEIASFIQQVKEQNALLSST